MENKEDYNEEQEEIISNSDEPVGDSLAKAEEFISKYRNMIVYGGIGILVLVAGYFGYNNLVVAPMEEEAVAEIFKAQLYFESDSLDLALNGQPDSVMGMVDVANDYSATKTGKLASYYAGISYLKKGEFENAIDYLEDFTLEDEILSPMATGAIGDAYVELGQLEEGSSKYMKAANMYENNFTTPLFLKKAGLVFEKLGQYDKATEAYTRIKEDFKESTEARDIDKYIGRASSKTSAE